MSIRRLLPAALSAVVMLGAAVLPPPFAGADTGARNGLAPGFTVATYSADDSLSSTCTAGFIVYNQNRAPFLTLAGHCDEGGGVRLRYAGTGDWEWVGRFLVNMYEPPYTATGRDIGVVPLRNIAVPFSPRLFGEYPVVGYTVPDVNDVVCKYGSRSGSKCGTVTKVTSHRVYFTALNESGDSGGPVYINNGDGTVTAVGITSGIPDADCGADNICRGWSVAELLNPWMRRWDLSL